MFKLVFTLSADKAKVHPTKTTPIKSNSSSTSNLRSISKDEDDDNISQSSLSGGIRGKLAALFNKEQTISETTIANKFKQEREREMEMLQNRFNYKVI
jgi:isopentenyl phosphate kinase